MRSVMCAGCGLVGWDDGGACKRCGKPLPTFDRKAPRVAPPPQDYGPGYNSGYNSGRDSGYNYAPAQDYSGAHEKKRMGHAIASLVIGILGFFTFGIFLIGTLVGTALGIVALKKENSQPAVYGGKGIAIAGIVLNILALCVVVPIGIVAAIAIPNLLASRRAANEASAISTLRTIHTAEATYASTLGNGSYGTLPQLVNAGLLGDRMAEGLSSDGKVNGYFFRLTTTGNYFEVTATPVTRSHGNRSFYVSATGEIHFATGLRPAGESDPTLEASYGSEYGSGYDSPYGPPRRRAASPDFQTAPSY